MTRLSSLAINTTIKNKQNINLNLESVIFSMIVPCIFIFSYYFVKYFITLKWMVGNGKRTESL